MNRLRLVLLLVCLLPNPARPQPTTPALQFKAAETTDRGIAFEPAFPVNWEQVARVSFHAFDIDRPDRAQIREHFFEPGATAYFQYEASLPAAKTPSYYYVLAETGLFPVIPDKLLGEIAYASDRSATQVGPPTFFGRVSAHPSMPQKIAGAGFVLIAGRPLTFRVSEVAMVGNESLPGIAQRSVDEKTVTYVYHDGQGHQALLGQHARKFPGAKNAYLVSISGEPDKYLFVQWSPDTDCVEGCCEHSYSLIHLGNKAENIVGNAYGCDV